MGTFPLSLYDCWNRDEFELMEEMYADFFREHMPLCLENKGGSIWLKKSVSCPPLSILAPGSGMSHR